jgi:hypothetical protein
LINGSGGGNATHLGAFTASWDLEISTDPNIVFRTFVAANGDELYAEGPGAGTPPPDQFVTEEMTITGGTGRFDDATGNFTVKRTVFDVGNPGFTDLVTVGSFDGTISTVGSTRSVPEPASMSLALGCFLGLVTCVRCRPKGR